MSLDRVLEKFNDSGIFALSGNGNYADITSDSVKELVGENLPSGFGEIRAVLISKSPYCMKWLERNETLIPSLDDMAQIIGTKAVVVDMTGKDELLPADLPKILGSNAGCFVHKDKCDGRNDDSECESIEASGYTITVGRTLKEAVVALTVLEKSAEVTILAEKIGSPCHINAIERKLMRTVYLKKYSKPKESIGSNHLENDGSREFMLRQMLVDYGKKLVAEDLVQGTWGNLSVRLDETHMLVTPSGIDYMSLSAGDMVKVDINTLEYEGNLKPTSEKGLHAKIYRDRPEIGGAIHTHSKYCSVFAAARKNLPVLDPNYVDGDPDAFKVIGTKSPADSIGFLDPVKLAKYALPGTKGLIKNTAEAISGNYGAILSNHGMIACGKDLPEAFTNCVRLEALAKAALDL